MKSRSLAKRLALILIPLSTISVTHAASVSKDPLFENAVQVKNIDDPDIIQRGTVSIRQDKINNLVYRVDKKRRTLTIFRRSDVIRLTDNGYPGIFPPMGLSNLDDHTLEASNDHPGQPKPIIEIEIYDESKLHKIAHHVFNEKGPISVWKSASSNLIYIVDIAEQTLSIYDEREQPSLSQPIPINLGYGAISVVAKKDDSVAYVSNPMDGTISVIDVQERMVTSKLKVNGQPFCQLLGGDEDRLYVITRRGEKVFVIDPNSKELIDTLAVKDLDREFQLKQCYGSCHADKKQIMVEAQTYKPIIPDHSIPIDESKMGNGLRGDQQRLFQNYHYKDHLAKLEKEQVKTQSGNSTKIWRDDVTFNTQSANPFLGKPVTPSNSELEQKYLRNNPIVFDLDVGPYRVMSDILKPVIMYNKLDIAPVHTQQEPLILRREKSLSLMDRFKLD